MVLGKRGAPDSGTDPAANDASKAARLQGAAKASKLPLTAPKATWLLSNYKKCSIPTKKQESHSGRAEMKDRYKFIMREIDVACGSFICGRTQEFQFMDVCCSPGGFSEYVLENHPAVGVGLSLNLELGGHIPAMDPNIASADRYHMHFVDVTTVASEVCCHNIRSAIQRSPKECILTVKPGEAVPTACSNNFEVMILDGSFLGSKGFYSETIYKADNDNPAFNVYRSSHAADQALLVAQLIIMVHNLKEGGDVVMRLSMTWNDFRNGVLCLLRRMFAGYVANYKPRSCHQAAISYYLVCRNFQPVEAEKLQLVPRMAKLLAKIRSGGEEAHYVPFPELPEGGIRLYPYWKTSLDAYYGTLTAFRDLVLMVKEYQESSKLTKAFRWSPCFQMLIRGDCNNKANCPWAHSKEDFHPLIQEAIKLPNGYMHLPENVRNTGSSVNALQPILLRFRHQQMQQQQQLQQRQQQQQFLSRQQQQLQQYGRGGAPMNFQGQLLDNDWQRSIMQEFGKYLGEIRAQGPLGVLASQPGMFSQRDGVLEDMNQARMHAGYHASNASIFGGKPAFVQPPPPPSRSQPAAMFQQPPLVAAPFSHRPPPPPPRRAYVKMGDDTLTELYDGILDSKTTLAKEEEEEEDQKEEEAEAVPASSPDKPEPAGPAPKVSGYLQYMSAMIMEVENDGHSLDVLLRYLGN